MKYSQNKIIKVVFILVLVVTTFVSCSSDDEVTTNNEVEKVTLKLTVIGRGRIDVTPKSENNQYDKGTTVTIKAIPMGDEATIFKKYTGDIGDIDGTFSTIQLKLDADKEITAEFGSK